MKKHLYFLPALLFVAVSCEKTNPEPEPDPTETKTPADFTLNWKKAWGTPLEEDFGGGVIFGDFLYFTGTSEPIGSYADVFVSKVDLTTQTLVWSRSFDAGNADMQPSPSENGHTQGGAGSRNIAVDGSGNVYICHSTKQGFNEVAVTKLDPSGAQVWQKVWEANASGLANGAAKAYALDVAGGKVFVTGSTGASTGTEESHAFLLAFNASNGNLDAARQMDFSAGYNDRGYSVRSVDGITVYVAGWEGQNNSGMLARFSGGGTTLDWAKRVDVGYGSRLTDIDIDGSGNVYLAADHRGVSSYVGVVKTDANGTIQWSKKFQGEANDRNNVSCVRIINNQLYVGGKGSFTNYDTGLWGDGCLLRFDLNGNLVKQYNFYTGELSEEDAGERIEAILSYNGSLIVAGESWADPTAIDGNWYIPAGTVSDGGVTSSSIGSPTVLMGAGVFSGTAITMSAIGGTSLYNPSEGSKGSCEVMINRITE